MVSGGTVLNITGATKLYVTKTYDVSGGSVNNASHIPSDLSVVAHPYAMDGVTPTSTVVKASGEPTSPSVSPS